MIWNVKKTAETDKNIIIGFGKGTDFDGRIIYDKTTEQFKIDLLSGDCDDFDANRLFQFLHTLILQNKLSNEPYSVRIG